MMVVENAWRLAEAAGGGPKMRGGSRKCMVMGQKQVVGFKNVWWMVVGGGR